MQRVDPAAPGRVAAVPPRVTPATQPPTRPGATVREEKRFYELDRWSKYNDPLLVVGFLIVVVSIAFVYPPLSGALLGAGMMKLAWMMGEGKDK